MIRLRTSLLISIVAAIGSSLAADYSSWTYHRSIVLNTSSTGANVGTTQTNFPVLIRLGKTEKSIFDSSLATGADIRFSKADNATPLSYEIESWSKTDTSAAIWVKVDSVKGNNSTQSIRLHYGNAAAASESNGGAVFQVSNGFTTVLHLGNAAGTSPRPSSVTGAPPAILRNFEGGYTPIKGIVGMTDTLRGNLPSGGGNGPNPAGGEYVDMGRNTDYTPNNYAGFADFTGGMTISSWIWIARTTTFQRLILMTSDSLGGAPEGHSSRILIMPNQNQSATEPNYSVRWRGDFAGNGGSFNGPINAYQVNTWHHLSLRKLPGNDSITLYINGVLFGSAPSAADADNVNRTYSFLGRSMGNDPYTAGKYDEFRVAKVARSVDWLKLEFQNQQAFNTLAAIGLPQTANAPVPPTNVTGIGGNGQVVLSWSAPASNGGATITAYQATVNGDGSKTCSTAGALTCTISGLSNWTPYVFAVTATNSAGTSAQSIYSADIVPVGPPTAPTSVSAAATNTATGTVIVSWGAPSSGDTTVTGYKAITVSDTAKGCATTGALNCSITGLTVGTPYTFTVRATNSFGASPSSSASTPVSPVVSILPGSLVIGVGNFTKAYTFQLSENAAALTENLTMVISNASGKTVWSKTVNPSNGVREISWNGLTSKGAKVSAGMYIVRVHSANAAGNQEIIQSGVKLRQD